MCMLPAIPEKNLHGSLRCAKGNVILDRHMTDTSQERESKDRAAGRVAGVCAIVFFYLSNLSVALNPVYVEEGRGVEGVVTRWELVTGRKWGVGGEGRRGGEEEGSWKGQRTRGRKHLHLQ